jgi:hypothetical protein
MADIIPAASSHSPNDQSITTSDDDKIESISAAVRRGRRPNFTAKEDLIIAREVSASKATLHRLELSASDLQLPLSVRMQTLKCI